jgi:hypothetical protein
VIHWPEFTRGSVYGRGCDEEESVQVTLLYFDGCPNWETTFRQLETLSAELEFDLERRQVDTGGRRAFGLPRLADGPGGRPRPLRDRRRTGGVVLSGSRHGHGTGRCPDRATAARGAGLPLTKSPVQNACELNGYRYPFVVTTLKAHDPEGGEPAGDDDGAVDEDELSAWPSRRK